MQERTKQVVRNEQLASVGFLAAGVAHEINNPLASIAMCAESLEGRIREALDAAAATPASGDQLAVIANYLRMIQSEAFRCKEITEKLLDFSRIGPGQAAGHRTGRAGPGRDRHDRPPGQVSAEADRVRSAASRSSPPVNAQEIKQVVLNLLTNALDSVDDDGTVRDRTCRRARAWPN